MNHFMAKVVDALRSGFWLMRVSGPAWGAAVVASVMAALLASWAPGTMSAKTRDLRPSPLAPHEFDQYFQHAARHLPAAMDWRLLKALAWKESNFRPRARSAAGAIGIMQLMPATARSLGLTPRQALQPQLNIEAAAKYLQQMLAYWDHAPQSEAQPEQLRLALASYNWGIGNVRRALRGAGRLDSPEWGVIRPKAPRETRDYVDRVMQRFRAEQRGDHRPGRGPERPFLPVPALFQR